MSASTLLAGLPSWVERLPEKPGVAIFGVGSAPLSIGLAKARIEAESRARFELIARLRANMSGTLTSTQMVRRTPTGVQDGASAIEQRAILGVRAEDLPAVSFPESHVDEVSGQIWVLCRLDLEAAGAAFHMRVRSVRAELEGILGSCGGNAPPSTRSAAGLKIRQETAKVAALGDLAELLAAAPMKNSEILSHWLDLRSQLASVSKALPMGVQVRSSPNASPLEAQSQLALAAALAGRGLLGGDWNLDLRATSDLHQELGIMVLRGLVEIRLLDEGGSIIAGWSFLAEGVGSDRVAAEMRFMGQVVAKAETLLDQWAGPGRSRSANEVNP